MRSRLLRRTPFARPGIAGALILAAFALPARAADTAPPSAASHARPGGAALAPDLPPIVNGAASESELRDVVRRYSADHDAIAARFSNLNSRQSRDVFDRLFSEWTSRLSSINFESLGEEGRVDDLLLGARLRRDRRELARHEKILRETASLLPFANSICALDDARVRLETIDPEKAAGALDTIRKQIDMTRESVEAGLASAGGSKGKKTPAPIPASCTDAYHAAQIAKELTETLDGWFKYYDGYDPLFSWWTEVPYKKASDALKTFTKTLREKVVGIKEGEDDPIVGLPIGRDEISAELSDEMIPYTPEELIDIANREFAWCDAQMRKASREMGFGDDWKKALEKVKESRVEPGRQTDLIRDLQKEALEFIAARDLVTVPAPADDVWRMEMMPPERQKVNPFFTGGDVITVSYPTASMDHEDKLMSMRGNNPAFSRSTVFHELIPGHHLQGFMNARFNSHREAFFDPFWIEGNAFYWETLLWDEGFPSTPQQRVGMLFWRMHRCARVIFSLGFHLGRMTPEQCIDFLVDRVGHERANAAAEVRRSFNGDYSPLYQLAYMIGALQFRALHHELVDSGRESNREFHDAILRGGTMPVAMVRARLEHEPLSKDYKSGWRFAFALPPPREP